MDLLLQNKVVIVTGGAKGIGAAIVSRLVAENATPVILDVDHSAAQELIHQLGRGNFIPTDLTDHTACQEAVRQILQIHGRIDAIVNNAGKNDGVGLENGSPQQFVHSLVSNAAHYYYVVHYALAALKLSHGAIVNIGSKTAVTGQGNTSGYVAAKGAILALTREWAVELLPYGIRVNAVIPAEVYTPMYAAWVEGFADPVAKLKSITSKIPLGNRMTTAEEIANTTVFLLSPLSDHTTGQWIHVDGGYTHLDRSIS